MPGARHLPPQSMTVAPFGALSSRARITPSFTVRLPSGIGPRLGVDQAGVGEVDRGHVRSVRGLARYATARAACPLELTPARARARRRPPGPGPRPAAGRPSSGVAAAVGGQVGVSMPSAAAVGSGFEMHRRAVLGIGADRVRRGSGQRHPAAMQRLRQKARPARSAHASGLVRSTPQRGRQGRRSGSPQPDVRIGLPHRRSRR